MDPLELRSPVESPPPEEPPEEPPQPPPVVRQPGFIAPPHFTPIAPPPIEKQCVFQMPDLQMPPLPDCLTCDDKPLYSTTNDAIRDIAISLFGAFVLGAATAFAISHYSRRVSDS